MQQSVIGKYAVMAVLVISLITNAVLFSKGGSENTGAEASTTVRTTEQVETLDFLRLFVEKVIQAPGEVSFDDRLKLENKIRELENPEYLAQWQAFVGSESVGDAEKNLKLLLGMLVQGI